MLDRSGKVQFNLNAKRRIAGAGINVKSSSKRKRRAFAFKPCDLQNQHTESTRLHEVTSYKAFREMQKEAHRKGVKDGQDHFAKYMLQCCVDLLKKHDSWDSPYKFNHPSGLQMCDGELPANYNKLYLDVTAGSLVEDITLELLDDQDEEDCDRTPNDAPRGPRHPRTFFAAFRVTFLMQRVYFKPITWCISLYYMITYFTVWRHFFRIMGCLFTTCISLTGKLTAIELSAWPL